MTNRAVTTIACQARKEHQQLLSTIDKLVAGLWRLPKDIQWGNSSWLQDTEILNFIRIQTVSLENAKKNTVNGYYRDTYQLIRMIFEGYLILRLISTCEKYPLRIRIKRDKGDPDLDSAKKRMIEKVQKKFGKDLIDTYMESSDTLVAVVRGVRIVDSKGNDTGVVFPFYYHAWNTFNPTEYHLKGKFQGKFPTLRFLAGEWAGRPRRTKKETNANYGALHKYFIAFDRILENLCLNGVLSKKTATRVLVHYNFLSNFSHSTRYSFGLLTTRRLHQISARGIGIIYDHYLSELALLYICHLLIMHLQHAIRYLEWRSIRLKRERKFYRPLWQKAVDDFGYFWFIFNKPHQYDKYTHANRKCNHRKKVFYRPEDIRGGDVRYYDNPLHRLKQLHCTQQELTTGNFFISPFHRDDAQF